jgi:hypothetical protein
MNMNSNMLGSLKRQNDKHPQLSSAVKAEHKELVDGARDKVLDVKA